MYKQELGCSNISENRTRPGRAGGRKIVDFREREAGRGSRQEKGPEREISIRNEIYYDIFKIADSKAGTKVLCPSSQARCFLLPELSEGRREPTFFWDSNNVLEADRGRSCTRCD